ncbi:MFS transporter [Streptomyces sp. NBC_01463]
MLLRGAVATPVLGRLGAGPHRRATILATPVIAVVGGTLTVFPRLLALLLVGRTAQGVGLGLTALMMGVVRDHSPERRIAATIALISVVSIIGAGVGYPLAGLLTQFGGVRAAHGLGLFVTAIAFLAAWRSMFVVGLVLVPFCVLGFGAVTPTPRARMRIDVPLPLVGAPSSAVMDLVLFVAAGPTWPSCSWPGECWASASAALRPPCPASPQERDVERQERQLRCLQRRVRPGQRQGWPVVAVGTDHPFPERWRLHHGGAGRHRRGAIRTLAGHALALAHAHRSPEADPIEEPAGGTRRTATP